MEPKVLLFDFDGTIADTADAIVKIYNEIAREHGYVLISKQNLAAMRTQSVIENMRYAGVPMLQLPFIIKRVRDELRHKVADLRVIEGIKEPLRTLKAKGYKLYIVSSNSEENIKSFLQHHEILEFDDVFSVFNLFGKHTKIKQLIKANNWEPSSVMYIGDEARDMEAARRANIGCVAVAWGYNSEESLLQHHPDKILRNPNELGLL